MELKPPKKKIDLPIVSAEWKCSAFDNTLIVVSLITSTANVPVSARIEIVWRIRKVIDTIDTLPVPYTSHFDGILRTNSRIINNSIILFLTTKRKTYKQNDQKNKGFPHKASCVQYILQQILYRIF